jgi:hypothetical protein
VSRRKNKYGWTSRMAAMQLGLRLPGSLGRNGEPAAQRLISWPSLWRGGVIALAIIFVLSTQFLFQVELYDVWPLPDILRAWLDYLLDLLTVGGCIFAAVGLVASFSLRGRSSAAKHLLALASIALGALAGEVLLTLRIPLPPDVSTAGMLLRPREEAPHPRPAGSAAPARCARQRRGRARICAGSTLHPERR